jgi:hypothetical protein
MKLRLGVADGTAQEFGDFSMSIALDLVQFKNGAIPIR